MAVDPGYIILVIIIIVPAVVLLSIALALLHRRGAISKYRRRNKPDVTDDDDDNVDNRSDIGALSEFDYDSRRTSQDGKLYSPPRGRSEVRVEGREIVDRSMLFSPPINSRGRIEIEADESGRGRDGYAPVADSTSFRGTAGGMIQRSVSGSPRERDKFDMSD